MNAVVGLNRTHCSAIVWAIYHKLNPVFVFQSAFQCFNVQCECARKVSDCVRAFLSLNELSTDIRGEEDIAMQVQSYVYATVGLFWAGFVWYCFQSIGHELGMVQMYSAPWRTISNCFL